MAIFFLPHSATVAPRPRHKGLRDSSDRAGPALQRECAKVSDRLDALFEFVRRGIVEPLGRLGGLVAAALRSLTTGLWGFRWRVASSFSRSFSGNDAGSPGYPTAMTDAGS